MVARDWRLKLCLISNKYFAGSLCDPLVINNTHMNIQECKHGYTYYGNASIDEKYIYDLAKIVGATASDGINVIKNNNCSWGGFVLAYLALENVTKESM